MGLWHIIKKNRSLKLSLTRKVSSISLKETRSLYQVDPPCNLNNRLKKIGIIIVIVIIYFALFCIILFTVGAVFIIMQLQFLHLVIGLKVLCQFID